MKRIMSTLILLLILCFAVSLQKTSFVKASGTIYITTLGAIIPSSAPIEKNGNIYTFTADINDNIEIQANNIIVNGANHTVQGTGIGIGIIVGNLIDLPTVRNVTLKNMILKIFEGGILLRNCLDCTLTGVNTTAISNTGIDLYYTSNSRITRNHVKADIVNIRLYQAFNNTISDNHVTNSDDGIQVWESNNNIINDNNITNNSWGIRLGDSSNNRIYHNNFINNTHQVFLENEGIDTWDDDYPSGGNYWSDFEERYPDVEDIYSGPNQNQPGSDKIWDAPYVIDENNQDNYPIVPEFSPTIILPLLMMTTLAAVVLYTRKRFR